MIKKFFAVFALIFLTTATCAAADGYEFDILATTHVKGNDEALTLIRMKSDGSTHFVVTESSSRSAAFVEYDSRTYNFYLNKDSSGGYPPLMFVMYFSEETRGGADEKLGVWEGSTHMLPVYALFDVRDEQIIFEAPNFYSGEGTLQPSHYHSNITEPVHTRLIEIFMRHMPELHRQVQARGVALP